MISEKRLQPVRTIGFFCTVIVLKIFNLSHLLLDLAPSVDPPLPTLRAGQMMRGMCSVKQALLVVGVLQTASGALLVDSGMLVGWGRMCSLTVQNVFSYVH